MRIFGERQEAQAALAQNLAAAYERFVSIVVNQLDGLASVVGNKYKAYCNKVVEVRRRKAQLQANEIPTASMPQRVAHRHSHSAVATDYLHKLTPNDSPLPPCPLLTSLRSPLRRSLHSS